MIFGLFWGGTFYIATSGSTASGCGASASSPCSTFAAAQSQRSGTSYVFQSIHFVYVFLETLSFLVLAHLQQVIIRMAQKPFILMVLMKIMGFYQQLSTLVIHLFMEVTLQHILQI
jgi:hypothetical protein